nr:SH3 domain-containing protein [Anaerolineae bacterium]
MTLSRLVKAGCYTLAFVIIASFLLPHSRLQAYAPDTQTGVLVTTTVSLRIRSGPGLQYSQIGALPPNTPIPAAGRSSDNAWLLIDYQLIQGWIAAWLCTIEGEISGLPIITPPASGQLGTGIAAISGYNLRLREGPTTGSTVLGIVPYDTLLPVQGKNAAASWLYVNYDGLLGWVAGWYTTLNGSLDAVPVVDDTGQGTDTPPPDAPPPVPSQPILAITTANLRVRSGPGTTYSQSGFLPLQATIEVLGQHPTDAGIWYYITYDTRAGWIAGWYTTVQGNPQLIPQVDENGQRADGSMPYPTPATAAAPTGEDYTLPDYYTATLDNFGPHLQEIFRRGQALGNDPYTLLKMGDSDTDTILFLRPIDQNYYDLGPYDYLQDVVPYFRYWYSYNPQSAGAAYTIDTINDPFWADPTSCLPGETRLTCDYRIMKPSIAIIMYRAVYISMSGVEEYKAELREVTAYLVEHGVIPVLSTNPVAIGPDGLLDATNQAIREIADEYHVPFWDLHATLITLPNNGIREDGHLTTPPEGQSMVFNNPENLNYGMTRRNLEALEVLHALLTYVIHGT